MKVAVVIPSLYEVDSEYLELCVKSLRETTDWEIIVVTNGSEHDPDLSGLPITTHIHTPTQGQCNAVNLGVQAAGDCDFIFISNSDMVYPRGWLNHVQGVEYPLVWSPNLVEPVDNAGSAPPFLKLDAGLTIEEFKPEILNKFVRSHEDNGVENGFNLPFFIRQDVWQTIGGYDTVYDPLSSNSDTDIQTKVELAGVQPVRLRDVLVYHFSNKSGTFDFSKEGKQALWQHNWDYYRDKWGYTRDDEPKGDPWYATNMLNREKLVYHPSWEGKYAEKK